VIKLLNNLNNLRKASYPGHPDYPIRDKYINPINSSWENFIINLNTIAYLLITLFYIVFNSYCSYPACLLRQLRTRAYDCSTPRVYTQKYRLLYNQIGCDNPSSICQVSLLDLQLHTTHRSGDLPNRPSALGSVGQPTRTVDRHALSNCVMNNISTHSFIHSMLIHSLNLTQSTAL
jgi:hypothetical protein